MSQTTTQSNNRRKSNKSQRPVEIVFSKPREGAREHLLANAELHFRQGLLRGTWLTGFSLWRANGVDGEFVSVTVPSRKGEERYFDWLRGDLSYLKRVIVKQYAEWNAAQPADEQAA